MFTVIFGRPGCPYCVRAKQIAEKLSEERDDFEFRYIDMHEEGITKADLEKTVGAPVLTVPQIFVDEIVLLLEVLLAVLSAVLWEHFSLTHVGDKLLP